MQLAKHVPVTSRPVLYKIDGTGRDSYIRTNNGGLGTATWKMHPIQHQ